MISRFGEVLFDNLWDSARLLVSQLDKEVRILSDDLWLNKFGLNNAAINQLSRHSCDGNRIPSGRPTALLTPHVSKPYLYLI